VAQLGRWDGGNIGTVDSWDNGTGGTGSLKSMINNIIISFYTRKCSKQGWIINKIYIIKQFVDIHLLSAQGHASQIHKHR